MDLLNTIFILIIIAPMFVVIYNIMRSALIISPSFYYFIKFDSFYFLKGYNLTKTSWTIGLTLVSIVILGEYIDILNQTNSERIIELIFYNLLIVLTLVLIEKKQPYSLSKNLKLIFLESDFFDYKISHSFQINNERNLNPFFREIDLNELNLIIQSFGEIKINSINKERLVHFLNKGDLSEKIIIHVKEHGHNQIQKKPTILFLNKILYLKELWNSEKFTHSEIVKFINENFVLECNGESYYLHENNISSQFLNK